MLTDTSHILLVESSISLLLLARNCSRKFPYLIESNCFFYCLPHGKCACGKTFETRHSIWIYLPTYILKQSSYEWRITCFRGKISSRSKIEKWVADAKAQKNKNNFLKANKQIWSQHCFSVTLTPQMSHLNQFDGFTFPLTIVFCIEKPYCTAKNYQKVIFVPIKINIARLVLHEAVLCEAYTIIDWKLPYKPAWRSLFTTYNHM